MSDCENDVPQLSAETFAALQEFYKEEDEKQLRIKATLNNKEVQFEENWQLSQFWYDDVTIETLVNIAKKSIDVDGKIALISCPSLYGKMRELCNNKCEITLFEFDARFSAYGTDFILYDYKNPLAIPRNKAAFYDLVIADPPFLSEECLTKTSVTIKYLAKDKIILCTGATMSDLAKRLLNLKRVTKFEPNHKNNLANEFWCYSNYDVDGLL